MSKKLNKSGVGSSNTLLNYFGKSPVAPEKKKFPKDSAAGAQDKTKVAEKENVQHVNGSGAKNKRDDVPQKHDNINIKEEEEQEIETASGRRLKKRRRIFLDDSEEENDPFGDESDNEYKPDDSEQQGEEEEEEEEEESDVQSDDEFSEPHSASSSEQAEESSPEIGKRKGKKQIEPAGKKRKFDEQLAAGGTFMEKLKSLQANAETVCSDKHLEKLDEVATHATLDQPVIWPHNKLEFLQPDKIKDAAGRRPDHPDYDSSTLWLPPNFLDKLSPGVRQWWVLKSQNFDCVLFFKVGKFYELYHMDADVGVKELNFTYMRGEFAHSGFPEISFDKMASVLVDRGYKIARVEQTETPDMMTQRCKNTHPTKFDKVVRREICQISNRGTQVFGSQYQVTPNYQPNYMLAIVEKANAAAMKYGICYIDTTIGDFYIGEFDDDKNCSRLLTLLSHHMPVLVLSEKHGLSERTQEIFRTNLAALLKEYLPNKGALTCSAEKTLKFLAENYYRRGDEDNWPLVLRTMQCENDHLGLTPHDSFKLALKALGLCIAYLNKCHLIEKILPMARYHMYLPPDMKADTELPKVVAQTQRAHMVLDAITLANLRITGEEHSLVATLDHCCTKFGKRLLHHWVCAPSCDISIIEQRQQAITDFMVNPEMLVQLRTLLSQIPDFERLLAQIHLYGNKLIADSHPDGRAILFEQNIYNKKKIQNFIGVLKGFGNLTEIPQIFANCSSALLKRLTQLPAADGIFPDMKELLLFFENAFDHEAASKTGTVAPEKGIDADYDEAVAKIAEIQNMLDAYLIQQEKHFGCRLSFFGTDKKRFQIEVPEKYAHKAGKEYALEGQRKGNKPIKRYTTAESKGLLKQMQKAEEERNKVVSDLSRRIFEKFSTHYDVWKRCVDCVANLDVLGSLTEYARNQSVICIPEVSKINENEQSFIQIEDGYHPCVSAETYIPNGIALGTADIAPLSILTGPNMGGKSTLMRQIGLLVVMAQIGAYVPAQSFRLSVIDRIFTRLGAQDDILSGQSTFLVELSETSSILKHVTPKSLVLLDELGRGTATYDGTAIASSVVDFLADLKCCTVFSTHYHNLVEFFHNDSRITLGHMACMVENEDTDDPSQETVTFLYKYTFGASPKSYGFNAAKLAGMPHCIIKRASELSRKVEAIALKRKIIASIIGSAGLITEAEVQVETAKVMNLLMQLKACKI